MLEALFEAARPVSAEYLSTRLGPDVASVYRNLETLEAHGVVRRPGRTASHVTSTASTAGRRRMRK